MMKPTKKQLATFTGLRRVIATLRGPDGCPWDKVQTPQTLRPYLLEEAHETLAAIDEGQPELLAEELGDLLFEVLLQVQIAEEEGAFTLEDVVYSIGDKLVRRHPHVFGDAVAETPEAVVEQWDLLKSGERAGRSALAGIPPGLPALARAQALQRRAAGAGFRFETAEQVWEALDEELAELKEASTAEQRAEEAGDALFALANVARWYETDAEDALAATCRSFTRVFQRMEQSATARGVNLESASIDEKVALWDEAKDAPGET